MPTDALHAHLERLYARTDGPARVASDPVRYAHRYDDPRDQELAALFAVGLAYGRVSLFFPVLDRLFAHLDAHGGPHATVRTSTPDRDADLFDLVYRWNRGIDFVVLFGALRTLLDEHGTLEAVFGDSGTAKERLEVGVQRLRTASLQVAPAAGLDAASFRDLPRGLRYLMPAPSSGSACKRWNLFLRWMVRPPVEGVDLGLWSTWSPAILRMPVDVHVHRIARFIGLTARNDTSWRTAEAITDALRAYDPDDPVRFDFALAHLGISGACLGGRHADICPTCPLDPVCRAAPFEGRTP